MASYEASVSSATTQGFCTFNNLCNGSTQSYACDNLIDITRNGEGCTIREAEKLLLDHIKDCVQSIETERGRKLKYFYIGKTHVRRRKDREFDHMNPATWKLDNGINSRCRAHKREGYGRDGLVVLTVVTKEAIPSDVRQNFHHEDYALALESRLIQDYIMTDPKLYNKNWEPGRRNKTSTGYPLYMAFKVYHTFGHDLLLDVSVAQHC